ncbi:MAG TPA: ATP-binding cassette domain-containing protein [Candidatus Limnocylindrales bacterium]|nr:ATP-binding cassette domain-containing protein [Candidatus Limnocylindrales bacterium]
MRLDDVWIRYSRGSGWVLREVTAQLAPGEVAVVLGRNGAGKSTLLSAAAGVLPVSRGRVSGRPGVVGWVPERFPQNQFNTTILYLISLARIRGLTPSAARSTARHWIDRLHLNAFADTKLSELSKGSAQKVGLAQALLVTPDLLVLDEPWEGLDALTKLEIPAIIAEVQAAGGSVLVSDHRGEAVNLPGAARWTVADGRVHAAVEAPKQRLVIEIAVDEADAAGLADRLRAEGHDVLGVRR